jgi:hypothetical protein
VNAISTANAQNTVATAVGGQNELSKALSWFGHTASTGLNDLSTGISDATSAISSTVPQPVKTFGADAMKVLNAPLAQVQHEYRYLHDVEAKHGALAAALEGIGLAAGAGAGFLATGSLYGAELGAEVAGGVEGQIAYRDSWDRTASASYVDPNNHQQVSLGRDLTNLLGFSHNTVPYRLTSGIIDGLFNLNTGGTELLGLTNEARSAEGLGGALNARWGGTTPQTVGEAINGIGVPDPSEIDRIVNQYSGVRRAFQDIANKTPAEIIATPAYQPFREIAQQLGDATNVDEVGQVFKEVLRTQELAFTDRLPSLSFTRQQFGQRLRESMANVSPTEVGAVGVHPLQRAQSVLNPANMLQRLSPLPTSFDEASHTLSGTHFNPASKVDDGTVGIYNQLRFTESPRVAASTAWTYHNLPSVGEKVLAFRNMTLNQLFAMGDLSQYMATDLTKSPDVQRYLEEAFSNPADQAAMKQALDQAIGGGMFGKEAWYGVSDDARNLSMVQAANGDAQYGAAIWKNQTGNLAFLDLGAARRAAKQMAGAKDVIGRADDFMYHAITQGIFKPLVLLTPSYAEHIALAEDVPNALREGVGALVKSTLTLHAAKLGTRIGDTAAEEGGKVSAISGMAWDMVTSGMDKMPTRLTKDLQSRLESATVYLDATNGHLVADGASSAHAYQGEITQEERHVNLFRRSYFDSPMKSSKDFGLIGPTDKQAVPAWRASIREISNDETGQLAAQELAKGSQRGLSLDNATEAARKVVAKYLREHPDETQYALRESSDVSSAIPGFHPPADWDQFDQWAYAKLHSLRGVVVGADKSINSDVLAHIMQGTTPTSLELENRAVESRPLLIKNRMMVPDATGIIQKISNGGFRRALNPLVDFLSRQPIAMNEFHQQWQIQKALVDAGVKDYDEAVNTAMDRTVNRVMRNVHNLHDRTQWTVTLRNWAPFYFAQEQAYRRMGRLLAEDPRAFRQYQLMISNVANTGQIFQGKDSKGYWVMPGSGWFTNTTAALGALALFKLPVINAQPIGMGWNLNASSVIFPLSDGARPGWGPAIAIPAQAIVRAVGNFLPATLDSQMNATVNTILGPSANESIYMNLVPNTILQRFLEGRITGFDARAFNSTAMQMLQTLDFQGKIPSPIEMQNPRVAQTFIDRWRNQVQIMYVAKAIAGALTPVSPELQVQNWGLPTELTNDINTTGSLLKGTQVFLAKHPDATPFTTWMSGSNEGITVPASVAAEKIINENMPLINNPTYGNAALLLLITPEVNATYNANVYNEQLAQGIRAKLSPFDATGNGVFPSYLDKLYVAAGDAIVLGQWLPQYEKQIAGLTGSMKYQAEQNWQNTLTNYAAVNPIWGTTFQPGSNFTQREAQRGDLINQMRKLLASPDAPKTQIAKDTGVLLQAYDAHLAQLQMGQLNGFIGEKQSAIDTQWKQDLYATVAAHPEMTNIVTGLFLSLPQTGVVPSTAPGESGVPGTFTAQSWNKAA